MKASHKILNLLFIAVLTLTLYAFSFSLPEGWIIAGSEPKKYEMGIDKGAGQNGKNCATIKSTSSKIDGFGTLMQQCLPDKYLGKRVRMSGFIKSKDAENSGLWMRVDQAKSEEPLSFDNMLDRGVTGTTDWKKYEIVLDVPANATNLAFGALLVGTGQIWFDNIKFEVVVDNTVPVTGKNKAQMMPLKEPTNLDFSK